MTYEDNMNNGIMGKLSAGIFVVCLLLSGTAVHAALQAAGPTTPFSIAPGLVSPPVLYPSWYQDGLGLQLGLCQDYNGFCKLTPPFCPSPFPQTDPLVPVVTPAGCAGTAINNVPAGVPVAVSPANFPLENFYYDATTTMSIGSTLTTTFNMSIALVGSFTATVAPPTINAPVAPAVNQTVVPNQITFLRITMPVIPGGLTPNSTYTVSHPYGSYTFTTDANGATVPAPGAPACSLVPGSPICSFITMDGWTSTAVCPPAPPFPPALLAAPCNYTSLLPATNTKVGPFLQDINGLHTSPDGNMYIGLGPFTPVTVTGSPLGAGRNSVTITGPDAGGVGVISISTPTFFLSGKVSQIVSVATPTGATTFPPQRPGVTSAVTTVTLTNLDVPPIGPVPAAAAAPAFVAPSAVLGPEATAGLNFADFLVSADTCTGATLPTGTILNAAAGTVLKAGGSCTFNVTFSEPPATAVNGTKSAVASYPVTTVVPPLPFDPKVPAVVVSLLGAIDSSPPAVVSTIPANNAVNVPGNNAVLVTFSEPVTGISATTFTLLTNGVASSGTVTFIAASNTAVFTPSAPLPAGAVNTATITTAVTDISGNPLAAPVVFSFTSTVPDNTPPQIVSISPAANETKVPTTKIITVTFNEPMAPASVNELTFTLSGGVTGKVTYDPKTDTATFAPDRPLSFNHPYTITISANVKSLGNVPMSSEFTSTFTTNAAPAAPHLYSPTDGAVVDGALVSLQWIASTDPDADNLTYHVFYCANPSMTGCNPVDVSSSATATTASSAAPPLAGAAGFGAGLVLAGFAFIGGVTSRRKIFFVIAALLISGSVVAACGKKSSGPPAPPAGLTTKSVSELQAGTRYWWKVVADDGNGGTAESEMWSFTTQ
jgi:Big-like domain-containing protein